MQVGMNLFIVKTVCKNYIKGVTVSLKQFTHVGCTIKTSEVIHVAYPK